MTRWKVSPSKKWNRASATKLFTVPGACLGSRAATIVPASVSMVAEYVLVSSMHFMNGAGNDAVLGEEPSALGHADAPNTGVAAIVVLDAVVATLADFLPPLLVSSAMEAITTTITPIAIS